MTGANGERSGWSAGPKGSSLPIEHQRDGTARYVRWRPSRTSRSGGKGDEQRREWALLCDVRGYGARARSPKAVGVRVERAVDHIPLRELSTDPPQLGHLRDVPLPEIPGSRRGSSGRASRGRRRRAASGTATGGDETRVPQSRQARASVRR